MRTILGALVVILGLGGCASVLYGPNPEKVVEALAGDAASVCVMIAAPQPYSGTIGLCRTNAAGGATLGLSRDGTISIQHGPAK